MTFDEPGTDAPASASENKQTEWDRRVVRSMVTADSARRAAVLLWILAGAIVVAALAGALLTVTSSSYGSVDSRATIGFVLGSVWASLGYAGIVLAAGLLVRLYAARLDLDIVRSDEEETDRAEAQP